MGNNCKHNKCGSAEETEHETLSIEDFLETLYNGEESYDLKRWISNTLDNIIESLEPDASIGEPEPEVTKATVSGQLDGNVSIEEVLEERGSKYGEFEDHANISQELKNIVFGSIPPNIEWSAVQTEAMGMILHKIARIANGDPDYADSWIDIEGYSRLVVNNLNNE